MKKCRKLPIMYLLVIISFLLLTFIPSSYAYNWPWDQGTIAVTRMIPDGGQARKRVIHVVIARHLRFLLNRESCI